ncbi:ribulose-phosphate 3-epimerase [Helcococcus kunzii]|uniref:Ribulose-phosphate 3-epimerase n=1 Tax=Helcococcus kunzii ATCC 51366 TaxID=883114 RepID=H3NQA0_9FIRM|nr:ribulose-phosphate 3-epimerase [Helcococcus kunzii]EHR32580.1 ribulose-phosphate 3-epimerase [Helcococcus kunzii ATCC 51366]
MQKKILCPSMMCANFGHLEDEVKNLENAGVDIYHMDFMDGSFVPNFGMGLQDFELVRKSTDKLVDIHLMIQNPGDYVEKFADMGADIIYVHPESEQQIARTIQKINDKGKKSGIAINPGTSVESIIELLSIVDYVMVMTVNPGFSGQKYLDYTNEKIKKLVNLKEKFQFEIFVDGAISPKKIENLSKLGVNGFILGTSSLFNKKESYKEIIENLRKL